MTRPVWVSHLMVTTLLFTAGGACADARKSNTLDRRTALALLQQAPPKLFSLGGEIGQGPEIRIMTVVPVVPGGDKQKRGEMTVAFLDLLLQAGILKDKRESRQDAQGAFLPAHVIYKYSVVPQEGVKGFGYQDEWVVASLAKPVVKEITGIHQEGSQASVEVSIVAVPNAFYESVTNSGKTLFEQCAAMGNNKPEFCGLWPSRESLARPTKRGIQFTRYDDGWRLMQ